MVFPSPGCQTCRKRRVKCDCVRPLCSRCQRANRSCTWDIDEQTGLHFKSENAFARGRRRRPRKDAESQMLSAPRSPSAEEKPQKALSLPLEQHAVNYWAGNFIFRLDEIPDIGLEYSAFVLDSLHQPPSESDMALRLALSAYSHAVFGKARQIDEALDVAARDYSLCVERVTREYNEATKDNVDQLILATMLLGNYENTMWNDKRHFIQSSTSDTDAIGSRLFSSVCHQVGASGLLTLRYDSEGFSNRALDRVVRRQVMRIVLLRGRSYKAWVANGADWGEVGPALELDKLIWEVVTLRHDTLSLFDGDNPRMDCKESAARANTLTGALMAWSENLPDDWKFSSETSAAKAGLFNGVSHTYPSLGHATIWNRFRALRLIVSSIRRRSIMQLIRHWMCPGLSEEIDIVNQDIASIASEMCSGVAAFFDATEQDATGPAERWTLQPRKGALIAWPLTIALSTQGVPEPQRGWLKQRLKHVATALGDAVLESVAEKGEFKF